MIAAMNRILDFSGPQLRFGTMLGLAVMVLGVIVCLCAPRIKARLTGRAEQGDEAIPVKLIGLAIAALGLILTIYLKG